MFKDLKGEKELCVSYRLLCVSGIFIYHLSAKDKMPHDFVKKPVETTWKGLEHSTCLKGLKASEMKTAHNKLLATIQMLSSLVSYKVNMTGWDEK